MCHFLRFYGVLQILGIFGTSLGKYRHLQVRLCSAVLGHVHGSLSDAKGQQILRAFPFLLQKKVNCLIRGLWIRIY